MGDRLRFLLHRIGERLWVRPLVMSLLSVSIVFLVKTVDEYDLGRRVPELSQVSIETLLAIISASMLVIATFAVASMVAAYASASNTATPRCFSLVISDDVSQNALSTFIGAFIFSVVALIALQNGYYDRAGRFTLFAITVLILAMVIVTFVSWVDRIARLGRLGNTIEKVEAVTAAALRRRQAHPTLRGASVVESDPEGRAIYSEWIGYVQRIDIAALQACAETVQLRIRVAALPGTFAAPGRPLAYVTTDTGEVADIDEGPIARAFLIGIHREFDEDPRFGLIVLAEIAGRALSPAVNDPGTAIGIIGSLVRLFALWVDPAEVDGLHGVEYDRVAVPELSLRAMMDDAFTAMARDGAGTIEVVGRLQKALATLASMGDASLREAAIHHSRQVLARAEAVPIPPQELALLRELAALVEQGGVTP
ncbi:DUF2254 domain-containing protein [Zobellella endophytica]|uniref:DUF2254 domain-containing protein n=1 Tax=Zobellella endophytica TaxID=2116700 RepID=A0A2P7RCF8_9GAMM|nr:DUF2254 domain-containing protein [Zobellella endophytica]PSJ47917.1 DUF2254 domain-containing protein [Zobellella endophytica]